MMEIENKAVLLNTISVNGVFLIPFIILAILFYSIYFIKKNIFADNQSCSLNIIILVLIIEGIIVKYICRFFFFTMGFTFFGFLFNILITIGIIQIQYMLRNKNINFSVVIIILITNLALLTLSWWFPFWHIVILQELSGFLYCLFIFLYPGDITFRLNYTPVDNNAASSSRTGGGNGTGGSPGGGNGGGNPTNLHQPNNNPSSFGSIQEISDSHRDMNRCKIGVSGLKEDQTLSTFHNMLYQHFSILPFLTPEMSRLDNLVLRRALLIRAIENGSHKSLITDRAWCYEYACRVNLYLKLFYELEQFYINNPNVNGFVTSGGNTIHIDGTQLQSSLKPQIIPLLQLQFQAIKLVERIGTTVDNDNRLRPPIYRMVLPPYVSVLEKRLAEMERD